MFKIYLYVLFDEFLSKRIASNSVPSALHSEHPVSL